MNVGGIFFTVAVTVFMVSCGEHSTEGDVAKKLGAAPKQIVDKTTDDVGQALKQGANRNREAEEGKN